MATLFHVSGWDHLSDVQVSDGFILKPGKQHAEGIGVYFSENEPRLSAAEGAQMHPSAVVILETSSNDGWYQSKAAKAKKFGKPRTWHSDSKSIACQVVAIEEIVLPCGATRLVRCSWEWT